MDKRTLKLIQDAAMKGRMEGIVFCFDVMSVLLNKRYGFADKRLSLLEDDLEEFLSDIQTEDWDKIACNMVNELTRIRKGNRDVWLKRFIKL